MRWISDEVNHAQNALRERARRTPDAGDAAARRVAALGGDARRQRRAAERARAAEHERAIRGR